MISPPKRLRTLAGAGLAGALLAGSAALSTAQGAQLGLFESTSDMASAPVRLSGLSGKRETARFGKTSDVQFQGRTRLDPGTNVGFVAELQSESGACPDRRTVCPSENAVDEVYISVTGAFGKVTVSGRDRGDGAASYAQPLVMKFTRLRDFSLARPLHDPRPLTTNAGPLRAASAPAVSYATPERAGVRLSVSLLPQQTAGPVQLALGGLAANSLRDRFGTETVLGLGASYSHSFERLHVDLGGTYVSTSAKPGFDPAAEVTPHWAAGGSLDYALPRGFGGLTVSGSVREYESRLLSGDASAARIWDAGLSYHRGGWSLNGYTVAGKAYSAQAGYRLSPGVQVAAGVQFWNYQLQPDLAPVRGGTPWSESRSTVLFLETALDF